MPKLPKLLVAPVKEEPKDWTHYKLWYRVREAILALPNHFNSPTTIDGMLAPDVFTLASALGATIEDEVVQTKSHPLRLGPR
jgi:hypothetical protein